MHVERAFRVERHRDEVVERLCDDALLVELLPGKTEIVASNGDCRTTLTRYEMLGREGEATFDFTYLMDGNIRFEKVCDGRIWSKLTGTVTIEEDGGGSFVQIEMEGRTKAFVPELAIRGPLDEQIETMSEALRAHLV